MSIFKKKGTVESLFRMGEGLPDGANGPPPEAEGVKKHEVYYVRGRPFIAPAKTGAPRAWHTSLWHTSVHADRSTRYVHYAASRVPGRGGVGVHKCVPGAEGSLPAPALLLTFALLGLAIYINA